MGSLTIKDWSILIVIACWTVYIFAKRTRTKKRGHCSCCNGQCRACQYNRTKNETNNEK